MAEIDKGLPNIKPEDEILEQETLEEVDIADQLGKKPIEVTEEEDAKMLFASFATAKAGGIPININNGVIRKPPPTPNKPERKPTTKLTKRNKTMFI